MAKVKKNYKLDPETVEDMDRLITDPPAIVIDGLRGAARNQSELIRVLVKKAREQQDAEKPKKSARR